MDKRLVDLLLFLVWKHDWRKGIACLLVGFSMAACSSNDTTDPVKSWSWTKFSGNSTLLSAIFSTSWNSLVSPNISSANFGRFLLDGTKGRIYYTGYGSDDRGKVGYAETSDLTFKTGWKNSTNAIMTPSNDKASFEYAGVSNPMVIKVATGDYRMWYTGTNTSGIRAIGYATSTDGLTWTKRSSAVFQTSQVPWATSVFFPYVLLDQGTYKMWFVGANKTTTKWNIGYATSPDGITWTSQSSNPVIKENPAIAWCADHVDLPVVLKEGNTYYMWLTGGQSTDTFTAKPQIGFTKSTDGITWDALPNNPTLSLGNAGDWDSNAIGTFDVTKVGSTYTLFYGGARIDATNLANTYVGIGIATSN